MLTSQTPKPGAKSFFQSLMPRLRVCALLTVLSVFCLFSPETQAQAPDFRWVTQAGGSAFYNGSYTVNDNDIRALALDRDGNPLTVNFFDTSNPSFGGSYVTNFAQPANVMAKYNPQGNLLWTKSFGTNISVRDVAFDAANNIYATGYTNLPYTLSGLSPCNVMLMKCDPLGNILWRVQSDGAASNFSSLLDDGFGLTLDASTNIYVGGIFTISNISFGSVTLTNSGVTYNGDAFIAKFDASGNNLWAVQISGADTAWGRFKPALDGQGNIVFASPFLRPAHFGITTLTNIGYEDLCLARYDPSGNLLWAKDVGTGKFSPQESLVVDVVGNNYLSGCFLSSTVTLGNFTLTNRSGRQEIYLAKFDANGNVLWARQASGPGGNNASGAVSVDAMGNVYQTGNFDNSSNLNFGGLTITNLNGASQNAYVAKYDAAGNILWVKQMGSSLPQNYTGNYVSVGVNFISGDAFGNLYLAGQFNQPSATFGNLTLNAANDNDIFLARLDGPQLSLQTTNHQVVIAWPTNATGLSLESSGTSTPGTWSPVTNLPAIVGAQYVITNPITSGSQFFRLRNF